MAQTALIIDDDEAIRMLIRVILEQGHVVVITAATVEEALTAWNRSFGTIDVILLDYSLVRDKAKEVFAQFRERKPGVRTLLMSGYNREYLAGAGLTDVSYLEKPFSSAQLLKAVKEGP